MNNEIVYIESGHYPLSCEIHSRQLIFWLKIKNYLQSNDKSYLNKLVTNARNTDIKYISYYDSLIEQYTSPKNCLQVLQNKFRQSWTDTFYTSVTSDVESKLGVYKTVNPELISPDTKNIPEFERMMITRYRCGSHYLEVEKGRFQRKKRDDRLCLCQDDVQTMQHIILHCRLVSRLPDIRSLRDFFRLDARTITKHLRHCESVLEIRSL